MVAHPTSWLLAPQSNFSFLTLKFSLFYNNDIIITATNNIIHLIYISKHDYPMIFGKLKFSCILCLLRHHKDFILKNFITQVSLPGLT